MAKPNLAYLRIEAANRAATTAISQIYQNTSVPKDEVRKTLVSIREYANNLLKTLNQSAENHLPLTAEANLAGMMIEAQYDAKDAHEIRFEKAANSLFALGLQHSMSGVLSGSGVQDLLRSTDKEYCGLNLTDEKAREALREFEAACKAVDDSDRCI